MDVEQLLQVCCDKFATKSERAVCIGQRSFWKGQEVAREGAGSSQALPRPPPKAIRSL